MDIVGSSLQDGANPRLATAQRNQEVRLLSAQVVQLCHELRDQRLEYSRQIFLLKRRMNRIDRNIAHITNSPIVALRAQGRRQGRARLTGTTYTFFL